MFVLFCIYILVCLYDIKIAVKPCKSSGKTEKKTSVILDRDNTWFDYLSRESTTSVKGILVILVFFSHFSAYITPVGINAAAKSFIGDIGQYMVLMFLFFSGYGIMESIKRKGMNYVYNIPVQKILKLIFDFDVAIILYLIMNYCYGIKFSIKHILLTFIDWESVGNGNWFIFAVLCTYLFSFVSLFIFRKNKYLAVALVTVFSLGYIVIIQRYKEYWWFDTIICYPFGMWYSLLHERIEKVVQHSFATWFISLVLLGAGIGFFSSEDNFYFHELSCLLIIMFILVLSMKIALNNRILQKMGELIFGVYILQRIPMTILLRAGILERHPNISFVVSFVVTVLLAVLFNKFTGLTTKLFKKAEIKKLSLGI